MQWFSTVFLVAWAVLINVPPVGAQSSGLRVAVLTPGLTFSPVFDGLRQGLGRLGYEEGKRITFIVEDTKGMPPDLVNRAATLAEARPDAFITVTTTHTAAAKQVTATLPIIFTLVGDPVRSGFIASYASSKSNLTGVATAVVITSGKRLEILKEIAPRIKRLLAVVANKDRIAEASFQFLEETAKKIGIQLLRRDVTTKEEVEKVLQGTPKGSVDAIYHVPSTLVGSHIGLLIRKAEEDRIPLVVHEASMVEKGALVSYGADFRLMGAQAAKLVTKILKGAKPSEVPIQTPERHFLTINLTTAKAIGIKIPREVLERTDRLVE